MPGETGSSVGTTPQEVRKMELEEIAEGPYDELGRPTGEEGLPAEPQWVDAYEC